MKDLNKLRNDIDNIDTKLVKLFEERMETVLKIAKYKKKNNVSILDKNRENEVIKRNISKLDNKFLQNEVKEFFENVMSISRKLQSNHVSKYNNKEVVTKPKNTKINVGFQGVPGSFSYQALLSYFDKNISTYSYNEFEDVFKAVKDQKIDYGILPIENSSTGSIADILDLIRKYGLYIVGEECIKVEHNLMGIKGGNIKDIEEVYSHMQGFLQSREFFSQHTNWKLIPYYNTAASAEYVSKTRDKTKAAVASIEAAKIYNLDILKSNINYNFNNYTRFIIVGKSIESKENCNKVSIIFSIPHKVGVLYNILRYFKENNLNMLKIESRPIINKSWEYFFYIDFEGNIKDESVKNLLHEIKKFSTYFKFLGNYCAYNNR